MHIYGLTGGIASGKTTVSTALAELGCPIIDADIIAREIVQPGKSSWKLIIGHFGMEVIQEDGQIDRDKLAKVVFGNEEKRHLLNSCTHPYIQRQMIWQAAKHFLRGEPFVVVVSPLLFESNRLLGVMKKTIVVNCSHEQQLQRLMSRDDITETEAEQRIRAQMPLSEKCRRADILIDNSGDVSFTRQQTVTIHQQLQRISYYQRRHWWMMIAVFIIVLYLVLTFIF